MGRDKASTLIEGEPIGVRIARLLVEAGYSLTVLGQLASTDFDQIPDAEPHSGPLTAIASFDPHAKCFFLCSCDIPLFDPRIVTFLSERIGESDAAVPEISGRLQPLCALYSSRTLSEARSLVESGERRVMEWIGSLNVQVVHEDDLRDSRLDPRCVLGANTPAELSALLHQQ